MPGLLFCGRVDTVEMVGPPGETVLTGLIEIVAEILVRLGGTLRGLDHHETDGALVDAAVVFQFTPVDAPLMVGDVDAVDLVTLRIADVAIEGTPTKTERSDEEIVEEPHVADDYSGSAYPPSPVGYPPQQTHKDIWLTTASRTVISVGRSDPFSANLTTFYQFRI